METAPFVDPNPGDQHAASDFEIWTVSPSQRVWAGLGLTGLEKTDGALKELGEKGMAPESPFWN